MKKYKYYISHPISDGGVLTEEIMQKNCNLTIDFANFLRREFPNIEFYVPAEHEEFVHKTYTKKFLTIPQILDIDCEIIDGCDGMIVFNPFDHISKGMQVEMTHCGNTEKYVCLIDSKLLILQRELAALLGDFFDTVERTLAKKQETETNG